MTRQSGDRVVDIGSRHERFENVGEHLRIGTRGERALLGAAQLRRGDGLHGLGDLPRVDHAADAAPDVENVCHKSATGHWLLASGEHVHIDGSLVARSQQPTATSLLLALYPRTAVLLL